MSTTRRSLAPASLALALLACGPETAPGPEGSPAGALSEPLSAPAAGTPRSTGAPPLPVNAQGAYEFFIPADFNGGIFGVDIDNKVQFSAHRIGTGEIQGFYHYTQTALGQDFIFSGIVTCFQVYDTPVLQRFPAIPPMTGNRAKWGGLIVNSNDPTLPPGGFIWFQSIDNGSFPDVSTLSGFGTEAANEAFCASANVPNPNFGPHALTSGNIQVN